MWDGAASGTIADMQKIASLSLRRPRRLMFCVLTVSVVAAVFGGPTAGLLKARNGFQDPSSASARALTSVERATGAEPNPGVLALVDAPPGSAAVTSVAVTLSRVPGVAAVSVPHRGASALVSLDGRRSIVAVSLRSAPNPDSVVTAIESALGGRHDVQLGGADVAGKQLGSQATKDLGFAELLAFPLLFALSLLVFRGVAAILPLLAGGLSVFGAFVVMRIVNAVLPLSSFSLNLVIGIGLGLAVDYSLLLVWRFREELGRGQPVSEAIVVTLSTAGRTVLFSGVTVAAAMLTLTLFPQRFLVSMGIGGAAVAVVAAASAVLALPPFLVLLAGRLGTVRPRPEGSGRWYRFAHAVMRRPVTAALVTTALLLAMAFPALGVRWSGIDATVLPTSQSARVVSDTLAHAFPPRNVNAMYVVAHAPRAAGPQLDAYAARLCTVAGVTGLRAPAYLGNSTWEIVLAAAGDPISTAAQDTISRLRAVASPRPSRLGGQAPAFADQREAIAASLPLALGVLAIVTLAILWVMTGSVVLPIKALAMNALTTAAATALLVFVFQDGRLTGPLAYTSQGGIEQTDFLVLAAVVFALSTDYGVLLLTRIKEARDQGLTDREAIAVGLEHTGRVVSASAILLAVAIGAFATSEVIFLKEVGLGVLVAVLIDAFIVRSMLVPSLMVLLGRWNWFSPRLLRSLHGRLGFSETRHADIRRGAGLPVGVSSRP